MKKHSAGALIFTVYDNQIYIVLGMEKNDWFPFKGTKNNNETLIDTAIREVFEETCGIVKLDNIYLDCKYSTKRKYYHIGLVFVNINILKKFYTKRKLYEDKSEIEDNHKFLEKTDIKLFNINMIDSYLFHIITKIPIKFYKNFLIKLQKKFDRNKLNSNKDINKIMHDNKYINKIMHSKNLLNNYEDKWVNNISANINNSPNPSFLLDDI